MIMHFDVDEAYNQLHDHGFVFTIRPHNPKAFKFAQVEIMRRDKPDGFPYATGEKANKVLVASFHTVKDPLWPGLRAADVLTPAIVRNSGFSSLAQWLSAPKREGFPEHEYYDLLYAHLLK